MEIKILQVFYDKNGLPYKDKERTVHYPITSGTFLGASNTTQIRFYYDQLDELNESTFVAVSKLPNGKIGSEILESEYDSELQENYAVLNLSSFYTQYKGDVYISLQGYQGGVRVEQDDNGIYQIYGTPTIQATGSIKLSIAYAPTFIGSGQTENITLQRVLAELSTKLGIRQETLHVEELPTVGNSNVWYVVNDDPNDTTKANIYIWNATAQTYVWVGDNTLDLGDYYTKEQGEQFENDIDNRVSNVESELSSVASGSPKGVYATLSDLENAYPTGTDGIYVVSADGHWYYWNGSAWTDGGAYLAGPFDDSFDETSINALQNKKVTQFVKLFNGESEYSNLFNPVTIKPNTDLNSSTGEPIYSSAHDSSDFIEIDPTMSLSMRGNTGANYFYCYDSSKTFLGYIQVSSGGVTISNNYPTAKYIKIVMIHDDISNIYIMYSQYLTNNYTPYSPIDGNLKKSKFLSSKICEFGFLHNGSYLDIDMTANPRTYKIKGDYAYVLGSRGFAKNTGLSLDTSYELINAGNKAYFTIAYDIDNNVFCALQDYKGDYTKYIIFGYYDNGNVYGNMGQILINGKNANPELSGISNSGQMGYLYNKGYMAIDTTTNPVTFKLMGTSYVLGSRGFGRNTGIALNTPTTLTNFKTDYCTIVYEISTNTFKCLQDYKGDYGDYIIFGYYDHGYIFGNMGMILLDGKVSNQELDKLLEDYDISGLDELQEQVDNNSTAIGVNASAIQSEASARQIADAALGARIDNLVSPSGQSVAEITDARVGYDGTIYASLEARLNGEEEKTIKRIGNILTVGVGKMYQTISAAISAAQNNDIILISKGVYEEQVNNLDKCVHIIGESKDEVIWRYPNTEYGSSPYECGMGSIRNLTIHAYDNGGTPSGQYGRSYCIHLDHFSHYESHPPVSNYFYCENVHMINDSNEATGIGLRPNLTVEFVNCTFETLSGDEACFYVHSSTSATTTNAKCILKNCTIVNNDSVGEKGALRVECYDVTVGGSTAIFQGNIVVNRGTGPAFLLQNRSTHYSSWDEQDDWVLDPTSQLNNIGDINYD